MNTNIKFFSGLRNAATQRPDSVTSLFVRLSRLGQMYLIFCALLLGSMLNPHGAYAQEVNEEQTFGAGDHGNKRFNDLSGRRAIIEVYALGAGGGGQGGHGWQTYAVLFFIQRAGTGGAGGGGAASYMKFEATGPVDLEIKVGTGGIGGDGVYVSLGREPGKAGDDGERTTVTKVDGNPPLLGPLFAEGGKGGGASGTNGGRGGAESSHPWGIELNNWISVKGDDGDNGTIEDACWEVKGGNAAILTGWGTRSSFGGGSGGRRICNGEYLGYYPETGGGAGGSYGSGGLSWTQPWRRGGNGQVIVRVIYLREVTFYDPERDLVIHREEKIPNGTRINQTAQLPEPTRAGYRFDGWWTAQTGGTRWTDQTTTTITADITLYARWTPVTIPVAASPPYNFDPWDRTVTLNWRYNFPQTLTARFWVFRRQTAPVVSAFELRNQWDPITVAHNANNQLATFYDVGVEYDRIYEYHIVMVEGTNHPPTLPTTPLSLTISNVKTGIEVPVDVTARGENSSIAVSFPADSRLTGTASLGRRTGNTGDFSTIHTWVLGGSTTYSYSDPVGADPCNSYQYQVIINAFTTAFSGVSQEARTTGVLQFAAPQALIASKGEHTNLVRLEWRVTGQRPIGETYRVYRRVANTFIDPEAGWTELETVTSNAATVYWNDNSAQTGVFYEYRVTPFQVCDGVETRLQAQTDIGFTQAFGTVSGRVTFGTGTAVEGVNVLARRSDLAQGESQFYSLRSPGGGQLLDFSSIRDIAATNQWTLQFWLRPDGTNTSANIRIGTLGWYYLQMSSVEGGYQIHTDGGAARSATIPANQWSHISFTRNGNSWNIFVVNDQNRDNIFIQNTSYTNSQATATIFDLGRNFRGHIDDLRFWNRPLTESEIRNTYSRSLAGNESGLHGYWTFDENLAGYAFDMSREGNKNHVIKSNNLVFDNVFPDEEYQLALKGITDEHGNYIIGGIPYTGEGTLYSIEPTLERQQFRHQFNPTQHLRYIGPASLVHNGTDFSNVSAFPATGQIMFANSNYPVDGVIISVNGVPQYKHGELNVTDRNGVFTVDVPIGENYITVSKPGHVFEHGGRFPAAAAELHDFQNPVSGVDFTDLTTVRLAGRVAGGQRETDKRLGFGLSKANIGQATITLETLSNYSLNTTGSDLTVAADFGETVIKPSEGRTEIEIITSEETGEFVALLPPVTFRITGVKTWEFEDGTTDVNDKFSYSRRRFLPFSIDPVAVKSVKYNDPETGDLLPFAYHDSLIITRFNPPGITVRDLGADPGAFGDKIFRYVDNVVSGNSRNVPLYWVDESADEIVYALGHPVFTQTVGNYIWEISAYEDYFDGKNPLPDRVPIAGLPVNIDNGLASHKIEVFFDDSDDLLTPEEKGFSLDADGKVIYRFVAGFPKLGGDHLLSATVSVVKDGTTYYWDKDNLLASTTPVNMPAYVLGIRPIDGNNFVTAGPDHVEIVLHDPPGSNSYAFIEKGSSMITEVTNTWQFGTNNETGTTRHLGLNVSIDVGVSIGFVSFGSGLDFETIRDGTDGEQWAQSYMGGNTYVAATVFNERIETSSDPSSIGAMADVYIGKSTNYVFGKTRSLSLYPNVGTDGFKLDKKEITAVGQEFSTTFTHSQSDIVNFQLPHIRQLRDDLIEYYPVIPSEDEVTFGNKNALYFSRVPEGAQDFGSDRSYVVYYAPSAPYKIDMVAEYNQWIAKWEQMIADNEKHKIGLFNSRTALEVRDQMYNRSFDSRVGSISESKTVSFEGTEIFYYMDSRGSFNEGADGDRINGRGNVTQTRFSSDKIREFTGIETESNELTFGFVLDTDGLNDRLTVDIYRPVNAQMLSAVSPDGEMKNLHGYTFRRIAGQTSCPHEAEERTLYFQPGQLILNDGTFKVENPDLYINGGAKSATIANIPAGSETAFRIEMNNMSDANRDVTYQLWVDDMSNQKSLIISIDGTPLTSPRNYTIPHGAHLEKIVIVRQSLTDILEYNDVKLVMGLICDDDNYSEVSFTVNFVSTFVAVTNIAGVPTESTAGTPLTLTGTVVPTNATNQNIVWSVQNAGTTGATIIGNTLNTTAAGTVTVLATIVNGETTTSNYTQDFIITVEATKVTGMEISDAPIAHVYPNPTEGTITLEFETDGVYNLTLADMSGKILLRQTVKGQTAQIDVGNYPSGVYLLTIDDGRRQNTVRVVKN